MFSIQWRTFIRLVVLVFVKVWQNHWLLEVSFSVIQRFTSLKTFPYYSLFSFTSFGTGRRIIEKFPEQKFFWIFTPTRLRLLPKRRLCKQLLVLDLFKIAMALQTQLKCYKYGHVAWHFQKKKYDKRSSLLVVAKFITLSYGASKL